MAVSSSPAAGDSPSAVASSLAVLGVGGGAAAPWRMHASAASAHRPARQKKGVSMAVFCATPDHTSARRAFTRHSVDAHHCLLVTSGC